MGRAVDFAGIKARPSSILIDLRCCGLKQVTYAIEPTPKNLAYAARMRQEIIAKHERGALVIEDYFPNLRQSATDTFNDFADQWLKISAPNLAETTQGEYRNSLNRFRAAWGNKRVADITVEDVITTLAGIGIAAKSFNNIISPLRSLFSLAYKLNKTASDLSIHIEQRKKTQTDGPDPLSSAEIERVLAKSGDWREYFEAAIFSGMRPSEMIALSWGDVDLTDKTLTVRSARVRGIDKTTKTSAVRTVRLPVRAYEAIKRQRAVSGMVDRVFIHPVSRTAFADTQPPSDAWKRICKLAGVRARDARQTRHTYATLMLQAGAKPAFVSRQMGHANAQMFFKTYAKWLDSDDDWREVEKLNVTDSVTTSRKAL
jgi:integrase